MATENLDMDYSKYDFKDSTEMYVHLSKKGKSKAYEKLSRTAISKVISSHTLPVVYGQSGTIDN